MYSTQANACSMPNSATPLTLAQLTAGVWKTDAIGRRFTHGNAVMNALMASLTPPVASPSCGDLQSSAGMFAGSPFPEPGGGPSAGVDQLSPDGAAAYLATVQAATTAALANASYGALPLPNIGGVPGVSALGIGPGAGVPGSRNRDGSIVPCAVPRVYPMDAGYPSIQSQGIQTAPGSPAVDTIPTALKWLLGAALVVAAVEVVRNV